MNLAITKLNQLNKNILLSVIIKVLNIAFVILIVRRSIELLGVEEYGIWTAITSIATWISLLDIGIGNGLRIELRRCFLDENWKEARTLLNTAYIFVGGFCLAVLALFVVLWFNIDWANFFNIKNYSVHNVNVLVLVTVLGLILQLVFSLIQPVLNANLHAGLAGIFFAISNGLILCYLMVSSEHTINILQYAFLNAFLPVFAYIGFTLYYFIKYLPQLIPNLKDPSRFLREETNFKKIREILWVSAKFFIIQISAVLMYQMTSFLIIRYFSPTEVTEYNVAYRYFNLFYIVFITVLQPLWSLSTDAYLRGDLDWISQTVKKYMLLWVGVILVLIVGYLMRDIAFDIWLKNVKVSPKIAFYVALYMGILCWNNIFLYVVNGTGKIHFQFILAIATTLLFFPLTHFFVKVLNWGIDGIFISNLFFLLIFSFCMPLQNYFLLKTNKQGFWNR
jgi:O-antigen/teichoic acid export membrane protein